MLRVGEGALHRVPLKAFSGPGLDLQISQGCKGVADDEEDYELPVYAERIPVRTVLGAPEPCPRLLDGVSRPATLNGYSEGRLLEDALRDAYFVEYPNG